MFSDAPRKQREELASYAGWVYGAVAARSEDVSQIKLHLMKTNAARDDTEEVTDHEALSLLRQVNPWTTMQELFEYTQAYKDLAGEAFWYLVKAGDRIIQIWLLRPDWMRVETDAKKFITGYVYQIPGASEIKFAPEEVIHHRNFNPLDPYRGMSIVRAAAITIDTEEAAEKYNFRFFKSGAAPAIVLKTPEKLDDQIMKRMRAQWQNEFGGADKAHRLAILEKGLEVQPFSQSMRDLEFLGGMAFNRDKVLALFKVPKTRLGMTEGVSVSNTEASINAYIKHTIKPQMQRIANTLTEFLLPNYDDGEDMFFTFDDPTPENKEATLKLYETLLKSGAISPNEIRALEGMDSVEGGDRLYIQANLVPITDLANEDEPTKAVRPNRKKDIPPKTLKKKLTSDLSTKVTNKVIAALAKYRKQNDNENLGRCQLSQEAQEAFWKAYVQKSIGFEENFRKRMVEIYERQEKETIKRLHASQKALTGSDVDDVLFNLKTENKVAIEILVPITREYFEQAGGEALELVGSDEVFNMGDATVRNFFRTRALSGIKHTNRVTRTALRSILVDAVREGTGIDPTARRIRNLFGDAKKMRALRIARTEIMRAGNTATLEGYKQSRVVQGKEWFTALDERVCEWCMPMNGRVKSLDNNYFHQGESFMGNKGGTIKLGFEDVASPPLHPNCRCVLVPIVGRRRAASGPKQKIDLDAERKAMHEQLKQDLKKDVTEKVKEGVDAELKKIADEL